MFTQILKLNVSILKGHSTVLCCTALNEWFFPLLQLIPYAYLYRIMFPLKCCWFWLSDSLFNLPLWASFSRLYIICNSLIIIICVFLHLKKKSPSFPGFVLSSSKNTSCAVLWEILLGGLPVPHWIWPCSQAPFITNSDGTCSCICLIRHKGFPSVRYAPLLLDWGGRWEELQGWCGLLVRSRL